MHAHTTTRPTKSHGESTATQYKKPAPSPRPEHNPLWSRLALRSPADASSAISVGECALFHTSPRIQRKLTVGDPDDPLEREADRVADQVMSMSDTDVVRRKCAACAGGAPCPECEKEELVQREAPPGNVPAVAPEIASQIASLRGGGTPLSREERSFFEPRFGRDLGMVRVHTDTAAERSAASLQSNAYTIGRDIVFARGQHRVSDRAGRGLMAHELAHVVQQSKGASTHRIARQPSGNPVLTPEEMFEIIVRQRAWEFNPRGAPLLDPAGIGRGVGPAAGGRRAGSAVFAVVQVTDANGRPVTLTYGEHIRYGAPHAEEGAVAALRRTIPAATDVSGGRMTVVLDQVPCPPGQRDCMGLLSRFARERGLELDIRLPTRDRAGGGSGAVAPRTAARTSQQVGTPQWRLRSYTPDGLTGGSGPVPSPRPVLPTQVVRPAAPSMLSGKVELLRGVRNQSRVLSRLGNGLRLGFRVAGRLFQILNVLDTLDDARRMATEGTLFGDAERQADQVVEQAEQARRDAEAMVDSISLLQATALVADAIERADAQTLLDLSSTLGDFSTGLDPVVAQYRDLSEELATRARAARVVEDAYEALMYVPHIEGTFQNAHAFAMHESLQRLRGRLNAAAEAYDEAGSQLGFIQEFLEGLAYRANRRGWSLTLSEIERQSVERERQREAAEGALRRIDLRLQIAENEAIVAEPVSRPQAELDQLFTERAELLQELRALE